MTFPIMLWVPWIAWVIGYTVMAEAANALQRGIMLLTPLVVGAAFSTLRTTPELLDRIDRWITWFLWVFLAAAGIATGYCPRARCTTPPTLRRVASPHRFSRAGLPRDMC
ncbi:MAG: hypothetical protein IPF83_13100 [Rhodanobacteraceae bacterium]|nr:hypothetical protein [Rhodanobacteraceae bacterium]